MDNLNSNKLNNAQNIIDAMINEKSNIKIIKKDKGLIERKDIQNEKIIIAEDNRQVIFG